MQPEPRELALLLVQRYNDRDLDGMMELFADEVDYIRPGSHTLHGLATIRERYEKDWQALDNPRIDVVNVVQSGDEIAFEILISTGSDEQVAGHGAVFQRWREGRVVRYRAYLEVPVP